MYFWRHNLGGTGFIMQGLTMSTTSKIKIHFKDVKITFGFHKFTGQYAAPKIFWADTYCSLLADIS